MALVPSPTRGQFTTTTLFTDPTFLGSNAPAHTPVPVAAIAGGSSAGVVLAILAVIGWKYWGRKIKKRERQELEKRKAVQAAIAYRRSVLNGRIHRRSRLPSSKSPSDRKVQFAGSPAITDIPALNSSPSVQISPPRSLKPRTNTSATSEKDAPTPPPRRLRAVLLDGKSYKPLHPSPLALPPSPRSADPEEPSDKNMSNSNTTALKGAAIAHTMNNEKQNSVRPPPASGRIPRIKASLSSLTGEARRQSKASQNSASDQSRHSSAGGSSHRWSWWSLINGPGRSLRQSTGKNRLSADTSLYTDWQEEDSSVPVGYAYSGVDEEASRRDEREADTDDRYSYIFLESNGHGQGADREGA